MLEQLQLSWLKVQQGVETAGQCCYVRLTGKPHEPGYKRMGDGDSHSIAMQHPAAALEAGAARVAPAVRRRAAPVAAAGPRHI